MIPRPIQRRKDKKYGWEQYKNLSEDEKEKLVECRKNIKMRKNTLHNLAILYLFNSIVCSVKHI